jgi:hypothetical protein
MFPIGPSGRRLLNQSTHSMVANSTASMPRRPRTGVSDGGRLIFRTDHSIGACHVQIGFKESGDSPVDHLETRSIDTPRGGKRRSIVTEGVYLLEEVRPATNGL